MSQDLPSTWSQRDAPDFEPFWSLSGKCSLFNIRDDISKYGWTCFIETIGAVVTVRCSLFATLSVMNPFASSAALTFTCTGYSKERETSIHRHTHIR